MIPMESSVLFFPCANLQETKAFYTQVLGLKLYQDTGKSIILDTNYGYLGFVQYEDGRNLATGMCISFNCPDRAGVDAAYEQIKDHPICKVKGAPQAHPQFPVYSFFFTDPNGYTLEFQKLDD